MIGMWRAVCATFRLSNQILRYQYHGLGTSRHLSKFLMTNIKESPAKKMVSITWKDNTTDVYPYIYLRDNCQCPECFFKDSNQRIVDVVRDVDINIKPTKVELSEDKANLSITWRDGHVTVLDADFLFKKRLPSEVELKGRVCTDVTTRKVGLWGSEFKKHIPRMKFYDILNDEAVEFEFLDSLYRYGLALVTDMPIEEGQLEKLGDHIGYLRMTAYG